MEKVANGNSLIAHSGDCKTKRNTEEVDLVVPVAFLAKWDRVEHVLRTDPDIR